MSAALFIALINVMSIARASSWSWTPLSSESSPRVSGHSAVSDVDGKRIFLFGGLTGAAGSPTTDDLWKYEGESSGWMCQPKGGNEPGRRMYAASAILDNSLYIFGGWDPGEPGSGGTFLDDIWQLSLDSQDWTKLDVKLPFAVSRHCASTVGDSIYIQTHKGLLVFSKEGNLSELSTSGEGPDGFSMCASATMGKTSMLVFGGSTRTQELSSDSFMLDTEKLRWKKLKCDDKQRPFPMASPCGASVGENKCIMFGGATLGEDGYKGGLIPLDDTWLVSVQDDTVNYEKMEISSAPEGRVAASLNPYGGGFILQGGYEPVSKGTFDKTWYLEE